MSSISSTLRPIRNGLRYSLIAVSTTSARWVKVAHPHPTSPGSVVSTLTMTRRMRFGAVRIVLMSRILIGAVPLTAWANASLALGGRAADSGSRPGSRPGMNMAPPARESEVIASRRFIVLSP
jgi:hypothetical protein